MSWSAKEAAALQTGYLQGKSVELLAKELGRTTRSIIMKLVNLGIYKKSKPSAASSKLSKPKATDLEDFRVFYKLLGPARI